MTAGPGPQPYSYFDAVDQQRAEASVLRIAFGAVVAVFFIVGAVIAIAQWNKGEPRILFVPIFILEWGAIGGAISILYQFQSRQRRDQLTKDTTSFVFWIFGRPIMGMVLGGVAYFIAVTGDLIVNAKANPENSTLLSLIAFAAGFQEKLSVELINEVAAKLLRMNGEDESEEEASRAPPNTAAPSRPLETPPPVAEARPGEATP